MPHGPVDDFGTSLFFTDSGAVADSHDYTTLFIFHGSAFNGHTFHKLLALGPPANVRLVIPNRRDYSGSTKYSDSELKELKCGSAAFLQRLACELAYFVDWFVEKNRIPPISIRENGLKCGGIAIMGWSMGVGTTCSLLGQPDSVSDATYSNLTPYIRQLINLALDAPFLSFGFSQPEGYNPFTDPIFPSLEAVFANFSVWVSRYYDHPDFPKELDLTKPVDQPKQRKATYVAMTPKQREMLFDHIAAERMEFPMFFEMQPELAKQAHRALFDSEVTEKVLPDVEHVTIACTKTNWYCAHGYYELRKQYEAAIELGSKIRKQRFYTIEGANHFPQWDMPEELFSVTLKALNAL
ncbi:Alpha/Beta hydrolase protein [Mycena floridula]|nr:Alpha/Beta hydrolase protein [Mycena floridula]